MDTVKATALLKQVQAGLTSLQQTVTDTLAQLAPDPVPTPAPTPAPVKVGRVPENPAGLVAGLDYKTYQNAYKSLLTDFSKEKVVGSGVVPQPTLGIRPREEGWAGQYSGYYQALADGEHTFFTASDDGSRLRIGDKVVVENDAIQATTERSGKIVLQKGWHAIAIDYYNYGGPQELIVSHTPPGGTKQVIPASAYARVPAPAATPTVKPSPAVTSFTATLR